MGIFLDDYTIQQTGRIELNLVFDVHVTAEQAQRAADLWVSDTISTQLSCGEPTFVLLGLDGMESAVWRIPVRLSIIQQGTFPVTTIDLSAVTGKIIDPVTTREHVLAVLERDVRPLVEDVPFRPRPIPKTYIAQLDPKPHFVSP